MLERRYFGQDSVSAGDQPSVSRTYHETLVCVQDKEIHKSHGSNLQLHFHIGVVVNGHAS